MKIIYYAANETMGDLDEDQCATYRAWAKETIKKEYPDAEVEVANESRGPLESHIVDLERADLDAEQEVQDFLGRLWDDCPWDWVD